MQVTNAKTAILALDDGTIWRGQAFGPTGLVTGEVCFNTAMTGYQEVLTDPSYTGQMVVFTFPHIGNCGMNSEDSEAAHHGAGHSKSGATAAILREPPTQASNWRSEVDIDAWFNKQNCAAISGIDTRALTAHIRKNGMQNAALFVTDSGIDDAAVQKARQAAQAAPDMDGQDLASAVTAPAITTYATEKVNADAPTVAVVDFGIKHNILALLAENNLVGRVYPAGTSADAILADAPAGIVLSNGPGDPQATLDATEKLVPDLVTAGLPVLGICLGHQLLALALGGNTVKMEQGHHGVNHPIQDLRTGKVEIVSMNHGYSVDEASLPAEVRVSYRSLFDGTISGLQVDGKPIISVQHHPEASPGPQEGHVVFKDFAALVKQHQS